MSINGDSSNVPRDNDKTHLFLPDFRSVLTRAFGTAAALHHPRAFRSLSSTHSASSRALATARIWREVALPAQHDGQPLSRASHNAKCRDRRSRCRISHERWYARRLRSVNGSGFRLRQASPSRSTSADARRSYGVGSVNRCGWSSGTGRIGLRRSARVSPLPRSVASKIEPIVVAR